MKIAVAQINTTVGDFEGNAAKIRAAVDAAREAGARLVVTPEMSLSGYPAEDLWLRDDFCDQCIAELMKLAPYCLDVAVIVGYPHREGRTRYNAAAVLRGGRIEQSYFKQKLPNYKVFDEKRYFEVGNRPCVFEVEGRKIGLTICEDLWFPEPAAQAKAAGAQLLVSINASPFHRAQQAERYQKMGARVKETKLPLLYVHGVGGQDEIVFDGASFALDAEGMLTYQAESFKEAIEVVELEGAAVKGGKAPPLTEEETVYRALMTGTADYVNKNKFPGVLLGLSGGIDSALVLAICVDALGPERVHAVMMPSQYTAQMSIDDAREMARIHGVKYTEIGITPLFEAFRGQLAPAFDALPEDKTEENLQSRIRGTLLMALSNKFGAIVVTTGNKSEMATGYCTLYGDMAGGFAVIKDIVKTLVYKLAYWRNTKGMVIPQRVIDRAPSAELAPGQVDQDTLPPYDLLDAILDAYVTRNLGREDVVALGFDKETVDFVTRLVDRAEWKRRQGAIGPKISGMAFGRDRRLPITYRPNL
jgi:NAD+ synthase (glutamine-hydrolysing)